MINNFYPEKPDHVPDDLTKPSVKYKRHVWLAVAGLLLFIGFYLFLAAWFGWTAYLAFVRFAHGMGGLVAGVGGVSAAFLCLFMIKALFFIRHRKNENDLEIISQEQPRLFEFLYRLADEAGAPRPHKVYLSSEVNACVFYDLSILNLL